MIDYAEKRDFIRMTMTCDMLLHRPQNDLPETVQLQDLSATGMRFRSKQPLTDGDACGVTITPQCDITPPMQATISVLRCKPEDDGESYAIAAAIQHILPAEYPEASAG